MERIRCRVLARSVIHRVGPASAIDEDINAMNSTIRTFSEAAQRPTPLKTWPARGHYLARRRLNMQAFVRQAALLIRDPKTKARLLPISQAYPSSPVLVQNGARRGSISDFYRCS